MEVRFVKIGNEYINILNIEGLSSEPDGIRLATFSGKKYKLTDKPTADDTFAMKRIIRKINEKAYDIVFVEDFIKNDEAFR